VALTPERAAELERLKALYLPLIEQQQRKDRADDNANKMGIPLTPPKPTSQSEPSMDEMRLALMGGVQQAQGGVTHAHHLILEERPL
jgi:hypothetical protein